MHLRLAMTAPTSAYASLVIHMDSKVGRELKMEPPTKTEYLRSSGAEILTFFPAGTKSQSSLILMIK
ncbi:Conserved_hypothetical protein [Hexamita inflata]|uniref:Uncharacterized protein n=1 Tax=Hexamita inflata TaxID=28002 RepID=A0AA86UDW1_9EUKA|nr:Conserved hypothetical protein [Hexamita inflata]